jgi:hypothetical protein
LAVSDDGGRDALDARSVVIYDTGDWVEYGSDGSGEAFQAEIYGTASLTEEQAAARLAHFFQAS